MEVEEFKVLVKTMKAVYTDPKFIPDKDAFDVWYSLLKDLDYQTASAAIGRHICSNKFPPTIADIRSLTSDNKHINDNEAEEAWVLVYKAIGNSIYNSVEEFNRLPYLAQKAVGGATNLRELAIADEESVLCEKGRFIRQYNAIQKREKELDSMPESVKQLILSNQPKGIEG